MTHSNFKRPQQPCFGQNTFGSHGSFGDNGHKGASSSKGPWGQSKDAKADFKKTDKSVSFKKMKREKVVPTRIMTPRIWPRSDCLPTSLTSVVIPMLALTMVRLATGSMTVPSQSLYSLRVL